MSDWPDSPVLVEVWRSGFLESVHRGALVVLDAEGRTLVQVGDVTRPVLPRSSNKPVQALAYLAAGWEPRDDRDLAIAAASHNGEDGHRELAGELLATAGPDPDALGCPAAPPRHQPPRAAGRPGRAASRPGGSGGWPAGRRSGWR